MTKDPPQQAESPDDLDRTLEEGSPTLLPDHDEPQTDDAPAAPEDADTIIDPPPGDAVARLHDAPQNHVDIEDADTELDMRMVVGELVETPPPAPREAIVDPIELGSVELSGAEAEQARAYAELERARNPLAHVGTDRVDLPKPTNRECRMCGAKTTPPVRLRLMIPPDAGLRCDTCGNVFCRDHVLRVSGVFESLLSGARFRCQLCATDA